MVKIITLNELSHLGNSDFNQPPPRHGLNLLYWFAQENNLLDPKSGAYGFHRFYNRIEDDDDKQLLPNQNLQYYEVGNLYAKGAEKLPDYIKQSKNHVNGNKDRIIVRLRDYGSIDRVYVTEHEDQRNFASSRTYRVSHGLLMLIKGLERKQFLSSMGSHRNLRFVNQSRRSGVFAESNYTTHTQDYTNQQSDSSWCTIL